MPSNELTSPIDHAPALADALENLRVLVTAYVPRYNWITEYEAAVEALAAYRADTPAAAEPSVKGLCKNPDHGSAYGHGIKEGCVEFQPHTPAAEPVHVHRWDLRPAGNVHCQGCDVGVPEFKIPFLGPFIPVGRDDYADDQPADDTQGGTG